VPAELFLADFISDGRAVTVETHACECSGFLVCGQKLGRSRVVWEEEHCKDAKDDGDCALDEENERPALVVFGVDLGQASG